MTADARSAGAPRLLVATGNAGKAREFRQMLGVDRFAWADLSSFAGAPDVEETGQTFRSNACLKASTYAKHSQLWTLADGQARLMSSLDHQREQIGYATFVNERAELVTFTYAGTPRLWDLKNGGLIRRPKIEVRQNSRQ